MTNRVTIAIAVGGASIALPVAVAGSQQHEAWTATLEAESEPSLPIGRVVNLVVDSKLKVYVNDGYLDGIAVLAPDLTFEQKVGRKGEGPGEFDWPTSIQILAGDSLFVFDGGLARVTVFEPHARTVAYTTTLRAINNPSRLWRLPGQRGYVGSRWLPFYATQREEDQGRSEVVFRLGRDGNTEADSLYAFPAAERLWVFAFAPVTDPNEIRRLQGPRPSVEEMFDTFIYSVRLDPSGLALVGTDQLDTLVRPLGDGELAYDLVDTPDGNRVVRVGRLHYEGAR